MLGSHCIAQSSSAAPQPPRPECLEAAASYHQVSPDILRAILWVESGFKASAYNVNSNGTVDLGIGQQNSGHLPELAKHGVTAEMLYNPCIGYYVAAWTLKKAIDQNGNTWQGIGAYHSRTPIYNQAYANSIALTLGKWGVLPPGTMPFPNAPRSSAEAQRQMKGIGSPGKMSTQDLVFAIKTSPLISLSE